MRLVDKRTQSYAVAVVAGKLLKKGRANGAPESVVRRCAVRARHIMSFRNICVKHVLENGVGGGRFAIESTARWQFKIKNGYSSHCRRDTLLATYPVLLGAFSVLWSSGSGLHATLFSNRLSAMQR